MKVGKRDRLMRLLKAYVLLARSPNGLTARQLSLSCDVSKRTTYRDILALQYELDFPLWQEGNRYGINEDSLLPPMKLTLAEAVALFLGVRLLSRHCDERDKDVESVFTKLAKVLPDPISSQVIQTAVAMAEKPVNPTYTRTFQMLASAWAEGKTVRIWYRARGAAEPQERRFDPYYLEPLGPGHACYVIGYCHLRKALRTLKLERIAGIELTGETFEIPPTFRIQDRLRNSWGVVADGELVEVRLRFAPTVVERVRETVWHPSQRLGEQKDGTLLFVVRVEGTLEIRPWILSWADQVEVLAPESLRSEVAEIARRQAEIYQRTLV